MAVKPIPDAYPGVTPYLIVNNANAAIEFYNKAFGAMEKMRIAAPGGRVGHAELRIGAATIMLADEHPEMGAISPTTLGGSPVSLLIYVADVDSVVQQAVAAGAKLERPVKDQFYGDRSGGVIDPYGHRWAIATHIEDISHEEMAARSAKMFGGQA